MVTEVHGSGRVAQITTIDATPTIAISLDIPPLSVAALSAMVVARTAAGVRAAWQIFGAGGREAAGASLISTALVPIARLDVGAAAWLAAVVISGNALVVQVTGALATTIEWMVITQEISNTP